MYVAKRNKGGYAVYDASYDTHQQEHLSLLSEIRQAAEGHQLRVYYQPKVGLMSGAVEGVEALIRWEHPRRGFVVAGRFHSFRRAHRLHQGADALGARAGHSPVRTVALERHAAASVGEHLGARSAQPRTART